MGRRAAVDDVLSLQQFEAVVKTAANFKDRRKSIETTYFTVIEGRYGQRAAETIHGTSDWLDPERVAFVIPGHEDCNCGYCKSAARRRAGREDVEASEEEILEEYWSPKSQKGARTIPLRTERAVDITSRYFETFEDIGVSYSTLYRRVKIAAMYTVGVDASRVTPQVLRATAATYWAWHGLTPSTLQALFAWKYIQTAAYYLNRTGAQISREMNRALRSRFVLPARYAQQPPTWSQMRSDDPSDLIEPDSWTPERISEPRHPRYEDDEEELVKKSRLQDFVDDLGLPPLDDQKIRAVTPMTVPVLGAAWSGMMAKQRAVREYSAFETDPRTSTPSAGDAAVTACGVLLLATIAGMLLTASGANPLASSTSPSPAFASSLLAGTLQVLRDAPDLEEE